MMPGSAKNESGSLNASMHEPSLPGEKPCALRVQEMPSVEWATPQAAKWTMT